MSNSKPLNVPGQFFGPASGNQAEIITVPVVAGIGSSMLSNDLGCKEAFGELRPGTIYPFATKGKISSINLLRYVLEQSGPADVYLTTWAAKEHIVKQIVDLKAQGLIKSIAAIFDTRTRTYCAGAYQVATLGFERFRLAEIHAKMIIVAGDNLQVAIETSMNLIRNKKRELGTMHVHPDSVRLFLDYFEEEYINALPWN